MAEGSNINDVMMKILDLAEIWTEKALEYENYPKTQDGEMNARGEIFKAAVTAIAEAARAGYQEARGKE